MIRTLILILILILIVTMNDLLRLLAEQRVDPLHDAVAGPQGVAYKSGILWE